MNITQGIGSLLDETARRYTRAFEAQTRSLSLSFLECRAIAYLSGNAGVSQAHLAHYCGRDEAALGRMLDRLQKEGLVQRQRVADDRRVRALSVTEKGNALVRDVVETTAGVTETAFRGLSARQRTMLRVLLGRVRINLIARRALALNRPVDGPKKARPLRSRRHERRPTAGLS